MTYHVLSTVYEGAYISSLYIPIKKHQTIQICDIIVLQVLRLKLYAEINLAIFTVCLIFP